MGHTAACHRDAGGTTALDIAAVAALAVAGPALLGSATLLLGAQPHGPTQSVTHAVGLLAAAGGAVLLAWWLLSLVGVAALALGRRTGHARWTDVGLRLTPGAVRRVAGVALGLHLAAAPAAWASDAFTASTTAPTSSALDASWLRPARPSATVTPLPEAAWTPRTPTPAPPGSAALPRTPEERATVTVRVGDCLWDLAAAELGPDATPREIDLRWREWHRVNRTVIGEDPDLLLPGTVLVAPAFSPHVPAPVGSDPLEARP